MFNDKDAWTIGIAAFYAVLTVVVAAFLDGTTTDCLLIGGGGAGSLALLRWMPTSKG